MYRYELARKKCSTLVYTRKFIIELKRYGIQSLCSELLSALESSPCEDLAAVGRRHPCTETVNLCPMSLLGLICHFHIYPPCGPLDRLIIIINKIGLSIIVSVACYVKLGDFGGFFR